jgi:hypothetical protein
MGAAAGAAHNLLKGDMAGAASKTMDGLELRNARGGGRGGRFKGLNSRLNGLGERVSEWRGSQAAKKAADATVVAQARTGATPSNYNEVVAAQQAHAAEAALKADIEVAKASIERADFPPSAINGLRMGLRPDGSAASTAERIAAQQSNKVGPPVLGKGLEELINQIRSLDGLEGDAREKQAAVNNYAAEQAGKTSVYSAGDLENMRSGAGDWSRDGQMRTIARNAGKMTAEQWARPKGGDGDRVAAIEAIKAMGKSGDATDRRLAYDGRRRIAQNEDYILDSKELKGAIAPENVKIRKWK